MIATQKFKIAVATVLVCFSLSNSPALAEKGRDNPFELPAGVQFKSRELPSTRGLALQAVVEGSSRRVATINNQNYLVGDMVQGREIVEIAPNHVILAEGPRRVELNLKRQPFSIRVTPASSE